MDQNPLEITTSGVKSAINKRGRPVNAHSIQFSSPQPKSAIIAQLLREKSLKQSSESSTSKQCWQSSQIQSLKQSSETTEPCWQSTASVDSTDYSSEEGVKNIEIKLEVVYETHPQRPKIKTKSKQRPKKHLKVPKNPHEKRFTCDYPNCLYAAKLSCNLVKHKRIHTSEKPYICDQCPFRTNFINSLKVHRRIHTAEKPYNCEHCGYRCNTSSNLKKHRMHRHPEIAKI